MDNNEGQIIKGGKVKIEGSFYLDAQQSVSKLPKRKEETLTVPEVVILENQQDYAIIRVTCSCGEEISLRCDYVDV